MDLVDRLLSAAGAVADAADRWIGLFRRAGSRTRGGPGATLVAGGFLVLATLFLLVGFEATDAATPRPIGPGVGDDPSYGDHAYVTVSGQVASTYGGHFYDDNGNGTQDPGEVDADFVYLVADPATHAAVAVASSRAPNEVLRTSRVGVIREDPSYLEGDFPYIADDIASLGLVPQRSRYIDARESATGQPTPIDLTKDLPPAGTLVSVTDLDIATWTYLCPSDADCGEADAVAWDVLMYDPASKRAIIVVTDQSPEWTPATFSGMLRREEHAVSEALDPRTFDLRAMGVHVSPRYLLEDGRTPASPAVAWILAAICGVFAAAILIGLAAGYLIYRRSTSPLPAPARSMAVGERLPVRVTGWLRTQTGSSRVREVPADLVRYATQVVPEPQEPASTLIVERRGRPEGVPLGRGDVTRLSVGDVFPLRGRRPAIRAVAGTGLLLLSFDALESRDRAAAELLDETGPASHDAGTTGEPAPPTEES